MPRGTSISDTAFLQRRLWTPAVLRPALWLDGADISTMSFATGVSEWRDKSGNGRHATQAATGDQPTLSTVGALSCLSFDGAGDFMGTASSSYAAVQSFLVATRQADSGFNQNEAYLSLRTSGNANLVSASDINLGYCTDYTAGTKILNYAGNATSANLQGAPVSSLANWNDFFTGVSYGVNVGSLFLADQVISATSSGTKVFCIGSDAVSSSRSVQSKICEILVFESNIGNAALKSMQGYLAWKWAIPLAADHPFANRPPLIGD